MCNLNQNRELDAQLLGFGLNLIGKLIESELRVNTPNQPVDVLGTASQAYQQGKITKAQFMGVINALDEATTIQTTATSEPSWNAEYLAANKFLNQFRGN